MSDHQPAPERERKRTERARERDREKERKQRAIERVRGTEQGREKRERGQINSGGSVVDLTLWSEERINRIGQVKLIKTVTGQQVRGTSHLYKQEAVRGKFWHNRTSRAQHRAAQSIIYENKANERKPKTRAKRGGTMCFSSPNDIYHFHHCCLIWT